MLKIRSNASLFLCVIIAICLFQPYDTHSEEGRFVKTVPKNYSSPVVDNETGLTWSPKIIKIEDIRRKKGVANDVTKYVGNYSYYKMKDWRIPTAEELRSISIVGKKNQLIYAENVRLGPRIYPLITNQINDHLFNAYIPFTDNEIVVSRYGRPDKPLIRIVRGSIDKNYQFRGRTNYLSEIDKKLQDFIKADGAAFFDVNGLTPIDNLNYKYLTFCPVQARMFAVLDTNFIKNLPLEVLASNRINPNDFYGGIYL